MRLIATAAFGLEAVVKREIAKLGYPVHGVQDGRVEFGGEARAIADANLWLRSADRVLLKMGEFRAASFDELFEGTKALAWDEWIPEDGKFTVTGKSVKSGLFSVPDCQAIVKKAIVEKLKTRYKREWFEETGAAYTVQVALLRDMATLTIDTSGSGLHKRGYRPEAGTAPIKETLAAAMVNLSYWRKDRPLLDPFCGSGTIAIEAALIGRNVAPGLTRPFAAEKWGAVGGVWKEARTAAYEAMDKGAALDIVARDIDEGLLETAKRNADTAGVLDCIRFEAVDAREGKLPGAGGVLITNPPYGERLGELDAVRPLYAALRKMMNTDDTWSAYVITSDAEFEALYGKKADARRKLFNGMIQTNYYQYYGKKPARAN